MLGATLRVLADSIYAHALEQARQAGLPPDMLPIVMDAASKRLGDFALSSMAAHIADSEENEGTVDDGEHPAGD